MLSRLIVIADLKDSRRVERVVIGQLRSVKDPLTELVNEVWISD